MFQNTKDAISWIESVKKFGDKLDLSRMELACEILGHPEKELNVIHIAGTNGKGSTVSYLKHILLQQGYNVGTFTSPYIVRFNERITYNYSDITDEDLMFYINKVYSLHNEVLEKHNEVITFFELVTLISFLYFKDKAPDYILYEVGLGGRLDATNVVQPILTAITSISFDHMGVLGNTLEEIAWEKLGIVKDNIPMVTSITQKELYPLFGSHTKKHNSELIILKDNDITDTEYGNVTKFAYKQTSYQITMLGTHQVRNACLAIEIIHTLEKLGLAKVDDLNLMNGLFKTKWPGRLEVFGNVILDGAHNIGGVLALRDSVNKLFQDKYIKVLFTSMADKDYSKNIEVIESFADEIHFTQFDYPRCETAENLYNTSKFKNKFKHDNALLAFHLLRHLKSNEILLVTGSLYFISYIRKEA